MFSFLQLDDRAVDAVLDKLFKNYKTWCRFLGRKHSLRLDVKALSLYLFILCYLLFASNARFAICICWNKQNLVRCRLPQGQQEVQQRKILYMGLYLLIWGEAANVRFMPECLCYIFHNVIFVRFTYSLICFWNSYGNHSLTFGWKWWQLYIQMAYELHGLLAGNVSIVTGENIKPSYGGDDEAFLRKVITPLYRVIEKVCCLYICIAIEFQVFKLSVWGFFLSCSRKRRRAAMEKLLTQPGATMTI